MIDLKKADEETVTTRISSENLRKQKYRDAAKELGLTDEEIDRKIELAEAREKARSRRKRESFFKL